MRPVMIIAAIFGSACAMAYYLVTGGGLVSAASPGSIISIIAMSPRGAVINTVIGVVIATLISFLTASFLVRGKRKITLEEAKQEKETLKNQRTIPNKNPRKIVFACEAGMGSSAMGAAGFRKRIKQEGLFISNTSVNNIPPDTDIVVERKSVV